MPRGPKGEKRPGDVIGAAIMVGRIATGETEDHPPERERPGGGESWSSGGLKGGKARAEKAFPYK